MPQVPHQLDHHHMEAAVDIPVMDTLMDMHRMEIVSIECLYIYSVPYTFFHIQITHVTVRMKKREKFSSEKEIEKLFLE